MSKEAFPLLHPGVQKAIFKRGWKELHFIQAEAIRTIIQTDEHLLICAQTAGGKTEAAFLPIISRLAESPQQSVRALYVGPLVALINDQFSRLETLCEDVDVPVHRWHGSATTTEKRKFRDSPGGILLITPESLESNFINYSKHLRRIYAELDFIIIDELHSFLSNVRGVHLRSLLARLCGAIKRTPRLIGLSATLGDPHGARNFLAPDSPDNVRIIEGRGEQGIKFGLKANLSNADISEDQTFRLSPSQALNLAASLTTPDFQKNEPLSNFTRIDPVTPGRRDELDDIATDIFANCVEHTNLVFANAKRGLEILADRLHAEVTARHLPYDPFHVHHGSLSKEVREEAEAILKSGRPATILCSSTLEMGLDIGSVRSVAQLDPPWSVASMRQRLGRSGRRDGDIARMRMYSRDESPHSGSSLTDLLFPNLIRSIALSRLMLLKWLEPHEADRLHLSTLIHQTLSILQETGGKKPEDIFHTLVKDGPFRSVKKELFRRVLRALGGREVIQQLPQGEIILAPKGEYITNDWGFYSAFVMPEEFTIKNDGRQIGTLHKTDIPELGQNLILGGRRWLVTQILPDIKTVMVKPSKGGKAPVFRGAGGEIHNRVVEEMRIVLTESDEPPYLDSPAKILLRAARTVAKLTEVTSSGFVARDESLQWFPWLGTRALLTLELYARAKGLVVERDLLSLTYKGISIDCWRSHLECIMRNECSALELAQKMPNKTFEKFDDLLPEELLDEANAHDRIDLQAASSRASQMLQELA
jgi:ATP-dependent Lhr-like helicase